MTADKITFGLIAAISFIGGTVYQAIQSDGVVVCAKQLGGENPLPPDPDPGPGRARLEITVLGDRQFEKFSATDEWFAASYPSEFTADDIRGAGEFLIKLAKTKELTTNK